MTTTTIIENNKRHYNLYKEYTNWEYSVKDKTGRARKVTPDAFEVIFEVSENGQDITYTKQFKSPSDAESYIDDMKKQFDTIHQIAINRIYKDDEGTAYPFLVYTEKFNQPLNT